MMSPRLLRCWSLLSILALLALFVATIAKPAWGSTIASDSASLIEEEREQDGIAALVPHHRDLTYYNKKKNPTRTSTVADLVVGDNRLSTLLMLVSDARLVETLDTGGPFTVFAPTDDAFGKLLSTLSAQETKDLMEDKDGILTSILLYHVVSGTVRSTDLSDSIVPTLNTDVNGGINVDVKRRGKVILNGKSRVIDANILASNGVVHVIDTVLLPPNDIIGVAEANGFTSLVAAVKAAGLDGFLMGDGPFTVFAPTDEAFATLLTALDMTFDELAADSELLTSVLTYHVSEKHLRLGNLGHEVPTVAGIEIGVRQVRPGRIRRWKIRLKTPTQDNVRVKVSNVIASNGIIHVIDQVLLPPLAM